MVWGKQELKQMMIEFTDAFMDQQITMKDTSSLITDDDLLSIFWIKIILI